MTLNLIFTKIDFKKRIKTIEEYRHEEKIAELIEQNKAKHNEILIRHYY